MVVNTFIKDKKSACPRQNLSPQKCSPFQGASSACPRQRVSDKGNGKKARCSRRTESKGYAPLGWKDE